VAGSDVGAPLVVLEGAEGVGKSTQVAALAAWCAAAGVPCAALREPGGTELGEAVRGLLLDAAHPVAPRAEALLFMAARAQLMDVVRAHRAAGTLVVLDRFFLSTYAYQIAGRGLPAAAVREANRLAVGDLVPDVTLLLTCDPGTARARVQARGALDRMERAGAAFHARVADAFVAALDPAWQARHPEVGPLRAVDAVGPPAVVARAVRRALAGALPGRWAETFRADGESHMVAGA
jgi:dTMP kinase